MGIRDRLGGVFKGSIRQIVDEILAGRGIAEAGQVEALRREVAEARAQGDEAALAARIEALAADVASLQKKLSMTMGAVQAATAQLGDARQAAEEALAAARQANQQATSAGATAEAAADGATGLESQLEALQSRLAPPDEVAPKAAPKAKTKKAKAAKKAAAEDDGCKVPGCTNAHRARGFCGRHYQKWRRGGLEGFVTLEGELTLADGSRWQVDPALEGRHAQKKGGRIVVEGKPVAAEAL